MQRPLILFSFALATVTLACGGDKGTTPPPVPKTITFTGQLKGTNENPTNTSPGTGTFTIVLDTSTNVLTWDVQVTGLTTNINNGHIHGPAAAGVNAGVLLNFNPAATSGIPGSTFTGFGSATAGRAQGTLNLTTAAITATVSGDSLKKLLLAGQAYVNVHTTQNPGGEVRGQIVKP